MSSGNAQLLEGIDAMSREGRHVEAEAQVLGALGSGRHGAEMTGELQWRVARAKYMQANASEDAVLRKVLLEEGYAAAAAGVAASERSAQGHLWSGILLGGLNEHVAKGPKQRIANAHAIRRELDRAVELSSPNVTAQTWYALSRWCFKTVEIGGAMSSLFSFFAGVELPTSSEEECEQYVQRAIGVDASFAPARLLYGDLLYKQERWAEAAKHYGAAAVGRPALSEVELDRAVHRETKCRTQC
jgi:hypothetical protein